MFLTQVWDRMFEQVEYEVPACDHGTNSACVNHHHTIAAVPEGGDIILAVLHQHVGGMGGILSDDVRRVPIHFALCRWQFQWIYSLNSNPS